MIRNLAILITVVMVYTTPLSDSWTWQAELSVRSIMSAATVFIVLNLSMKPCALVVAGCEILALIYNVILTIGYSLDVPGIDAFYDVVMVTLFATEVLAILLGMSDELRRLQQNRKYRDYVTRPDTRSYFMGESLQ